MALVLIADGDELVVDVVRAALGARGHVVGTVEDGTPIASMVEFKRPELVILDCGMPKFSGLAALRQIRVLRTAYATPVLILTPWHSEFDEHIAIRAGANDCLCKPFDPDQLVSRVELLLRRAALQYQQAPPPPKFRPPLTTPRAGGQG